MFLLAGQSNMAGRGRVAEEDTVVHPRVFALSKDNEWVPAKDPIHFDKRVAGVGLGRTFGITLAEGDSSLAVGLIPCAVGGSPIASWEPGEYYPPTKSHPYDDAVKRTKIAMQRGTLKAILWHQGESDSKPELAGVYEKKLHALVARFRKEFGVPGLPFIAGQLGHFPDRPWDEARSLVNSVHESLPKKVKNTAFVASKGLTHKGDKVHFDAKSIREFGKRYAEAYVCLLEKTGEKDEPAKKLVLFDGKTLDGWKKAKFGGEGDVKVENGSITLSRGTSLT
ncbi:MAG: sialate O-acetylesterase, partial [Planctomycetota bacterium]